jgi:hypothetical protein
MGTIKEISSNLLRISKGDVSLYERATSTFEQRIGSVRWSDKTAVSMPIDHASPHVANASK